MSELSDALRAQRMEIAGQVHDRIIPPLFAARMRLEALAERIGQALPSESPRVDADAAHARPSVSSDLQEAVDLIVLAISVSRQLLTDLVPPANGKAHWESQIRRALGDRSVEFREQGNLPWDQLQPETAMTITLIAEEAVRNAIRHADPKRIEIIFDPVSHVPAASDFVDQGLHTLTILDDGKGFDPAAATDHHGLRLMQLRAAAIDGSLEFSTRPGGPTKVTLRWPIAAGGSG